MASSLSYSRRFASSWQRTKSRRAESGCPVDGTAPIWNAVLVGDVSRSGVSATHGGPNAAVAYRVLNWYRIPVRSWSYVPTAEPRVRARFVILPPASR
jgi:hypothetical protein